MFYECENYNQDISSWDVSNVTNMSGMFLGCALFKQDISSWDVSAVKYKKDIFKYCPIEDKYKPKFE